MQHSPIPTASDGGSRSVVLNDAGIYPYYCEIHGVPFNMYGVIYVDHQHCNEAGKHIIVYILYCVLTRALAWLEFHINDLVGNSVSSVALWTVILVVFLFLL